jgi:hypothetical protein
MEYTVSADLKVLDKGFGEKLTEQELLEAGANIDALIAAGSVTQSTPAQKAPAVSQAPKVSEFNTTNYEGDK